MLPKKLSSYRFTQQDKFELINFKPEEVALAIEELGYSFARANTEFEQRKDYLDRIGNSLTAEYRPRAGSVSGARIMAEISDRYQEALESLRESEQRKIEAQSSFKAAESYAKMLITKVSSEAKIADHYQKRSGVS